MSAVLPDRHEWDAANAHSRANPDHVLGPYDDDDGNIRIECYNCDFDTAKLAGAA